MGDVEELKEQLAKMAERMVFLEQKLQTSQKDLIKEALTEFTAQKRKDPLKAEVLRKFNRGKRELIKQKMVEAVTAKPMKVSDLKYYLVDQLGYCSKASFYRYIEELYDYIEIQGGVVYLLNNVTV